MLKLQTGISDMAFIEPDMSPKEKSERMKKILVSVGLTPLEWTKKIIPEQEKQTYLKNLNDYFKSLHFDKKTASAMKPTVYDTSLTGRMTNHVLDAVRLFNSHAVDFGFMEDPYDNSIYVGSSRLNGLTYSSVISGMRCYSVQGRVHTYVSKLLEAVEAYRSGISLTMTDSQFDVTLSGFSDFLSKFIWDKEIVETIISFFKIPYDLDHLVISNGNVVAPLSFIESRSKHRMLFPPMVSMPSVILRGNHEDTLKEISKRLDTFDPDSLIEISTKADGVAVQIQFKGDLSEIYCMTRYKYYQGAVFHEYVFNPEKPNPDYNERQQLFHENLLSFLNKVKKDMQFQDDKHYVVCCELLAKEERKYRSGNETVDLVKFARRQAVAGAITKLKQENNVDNEGNYFIEKAKITEYSFYVYGLYSFLDYQAAMTFPSLVNFTTDSKKVNAVDIFKNARTFVKRIEVSRDSIGNGDVLNAYDKTTSSYRRVKANEKKEILDALFVKIVYYSGLEENHKLLPSDGIVIREIRTKGNLEEERYTQTENKSCFAVKFNSEKTYVRVLSVEKKVGVTGRETYLANIEPTEVMSMYGESICVVSKVVVYNKKNIDTIVKKDASLVLCLSGQVVPVLYANEESTEVL